MQTKYVIIDLEMCRIPKGSRKKEIDIPCEIIQIGAVLLDESYEIIDSYMTYVRPEFGSIDSFIRKLTGISYNNVVNAPRLEEALESFLKWLPEDVIFVSWSDNDPLQIKEELQQKHLNFLAFDYFFEEWIDCQEVFAKEVHSNRSYNLTEALNVANIDYDENCHDALVDAKNTALLFSKIKSGCLCIKMTEGQSFSNCPFASLFNSIVVS